MNCVIVCLPLFLSHSLAIWSATCAEGNQTCSQLHQLTHAPQQKADNLVCTHLKKLRKLIRNKSMELDEYDQGEDLVSEGRKSAFKGFYR